MRRIYLLLLLGVLVPLCLWAQSSTISGLTSDVAPADSDMLIVQKSGDARAKKTTRGDLRSGLCPTSRTISTTAPLTGGGALTSNLTLGITNVYGWTDTGTDVQLQTSTDSLGVGAAALAGGKVHIAAGSKTPAGEVGGLVITGASTLERLPMGYETGVGGWIQSVLNGTGQTALRLNPTGGNVGIGVTPGRKLDVSGDSRQRGDFFFQKGSSPFLGPEDSFDLRLGTASTEFVRIDTSGRLGVGTGASPTAKLDVNGSIRERTTCTPASATAACNAGDHCWDTSFEYRCVATNTWKRAALSTW